MNVIRHALIPVCVIAMCFSAIALAQEVVSINDVKSIPATPKPTRITEAGAMRKSQTPITVMANNPLVTQQMEAARKLPKGKAQNNNSQKGKQPAQGPAIEIIHLDQPASARTVVNHGPTFVFQDITQRDSTQMAQQGVLSKAQRFQQVEALRQSASASKVQSGN